MPPNARGISGSAISAKANASIANNTFLPTFEAGSATAYESAALSEVSKRYLFREFGNGWANDNNARRDLSKSTAQAQDLFFPMEDGLTASSFQTGYTAVTPEGIYPASANQQVHFSWIGTGFTIVNNTNFANNAGANQYIHYTIAQNLSYGTHIFKFKRDGTVTNSPMWIDGVQVHTGWIRFDELIFHQPKKPPIPDDAVVIADYMLMADFVPCTTGHDANGPGAISKGVRLQKATHDIWTDSGAAITYNQGYQGSTHGVSLYNNNATSEGRCVGFGSAFGCHYLRDTNREADIMVRLDGANYTETGSNEYDTGVEWDSHSDGAITKNGANGFHVYGIKGQTLGNHTFGDKKLSGSNYNAWSAFEIATPIHTSSHYQNFESSVRNELIGGDRNMEQTNLIVTSDGKSWDEVTRDTSYIGNICVIADTDTDFDWSAFVVLSHWRGEKASSKIKFCTKNFAIAYDRLLCLVDGDYRVTAWQAYSDDASANFAIMVNDTYTAFAYGAPSNVPLQADVNIYLKRGDHIQLRGEFGIDSAGYHGFQIIRV